MAIDLKHKNREHIFFKKKERKRLVYQRTSSGCLRSHAPDLLYVPSGETIRLMI